MAANTNTFSIHQVRDDRNQYEKGIIAILLSNRREANEKCKKKIVEREYILERSPDGSVSSERVLQL